MENHAKYGEAIYFHNRHSGSISSFLGAQLARGLSLRQETRYPESDKVISRLSATADQFFLASALSGLGHTRRERRGQRPARHGCSETGQLHRDQENLETGDRVELTIPMSSGWKQCLITLSALAILYGPTVLAGEIGPEDAETSVSLVRR